MANSFSICSLILVSILNNVQSIVVNTTIGQIEGNDGIVNTFYLIPFAKPPVGELRFASPEAITDPIGTDSTPFDATVESNLGCPHEADASVLPDTQSEDCLYLNVYTPSDAKMGVTSYTVMIWIYGGSFKFGWGTQFVYDGTNWVDMVDDIIIVTLNYRLGILGFLYDNQYDTGVIGNYGLEDQAMAIKWVYDNIAYFGGDPSNINIFGESAGAASVSLHLLYNSAYIKSGIMQSPFPLIPLREPSTWGDAAFQFSDLTDCSNYTSDSTQLLDCWRNVPIDTITTVQDNPLMWSNLKGLQAGVPWTPTVGIEWNGNDMVQPMWAIGRDSTPPFMIGTNGGEGYSFIDMDLPNSWDVALGSWFVTVGDLAIASAILDYYNVTSTHSISGDYRFDNAAIVTDWWRCSIRYQLDQLGDNTANHYYYNFDVVNSVMNQFVFWPTTPECQNVACHFVDVFYLFMTDEIISGADQTGQNVSTQAIGDEMQRLWSNYAKTLNANDAGDGEDLINVWPEYTNEYQMDNFLDIVGFEQFEKSSTDTDMSDICVFWNKVGYAGQYSNPYTDEPTGSPTMEPTAQPIEPESIEPDHAFINKPFIAMYIILGVLLCFR